ncbi:MAG: hypothetical protein H6905_02535 [Hyphomicrobiales bacterium]|nr:hypothetical protein [Hyphomicrobiales bacterium]
MTAFALAFDTLFADPNLGRIAVYRVGGAGSDIPVRIILRRTDEIGNFGETRIIAETVVIDVPVSEIAAPAEGDTFTIGGETFVVQGEPVRDAERLVWTLEARPQ